MGDRPIIFSRSMIVALLAGRKTMTRRLVPAGHRFWESDGGEMRPIPMKPKVGDRLWVREAWALVGAYRGIDPGTGALAAGCFYRADNNTLDGEIDRWRPSIHMPRWASRLTLLVEAVKVERLQEISEEDAIAEGCGWHQGPMPAGDADLLVGDPKPAYSNLWERLHGPGSWAANPWVIAISFRPISSNIDAIAEASNAA